MSVALRCEEISDRDAERLFEAAETTPGVVARLKRWPSRMPTRPAGRLKSCGAERSSANPGLLALGAILVMDNI